MAAEHAQFVAYIRQSFFHEQLLDDQFIRTEAVDENLRGFLEDFYLTYFREAQRLIWILKQLLKGDPIDAKSIETHLHDFRAKTRGCGAIKVLTQINRCIEYSSAMDFARCLANLEETEKEMKYLKRQLKNYFKLKKQRPLKRTTKLKSQAKVGGKEVKTEGE